MVQFKSKHATDYIMPASMAGLAQPKPEGMTFSVDEPQIPPWRGLSDEFDKYF